MNKIFKAVWNESSGTWVAASETSRSKTKRKSSRGKLAIVCAIVAGGAVSGAGLCRYDDWSVGTGSESLEVGTAARATEDYALAIGTIATASGNAAVALGAGEKPCNVQRRHG